MYAISFCLYGTYNPKYYDGLLENIKLINRHLPDWIIYVYVGSDVSESFRQKLEAYRGVRLRSVDAIGPILMMHRFLAVDEPDVECMIVRDADSRLHHRDRWAIQDFVDSTYQAHTIRDHPQHYTELLGGLWGLKKGDHIPRMRSLVEPYLDTPWKFGYDQKFLRDIVYPKVRHVLLVHTSQTFRYSDEETHREFPWVLTEACYCGKAEGNQSSSLLGIFRR